MSDTVDWEFASTSTGGDVDFLKECLGDLLRDSDRCCAEIAHGIEERDFKKISHAAHEIKGCSSYLGCNKLRDAGFALEHGSKVGLGPDPNCEAVLEDSKVKFAAFSKCVEEVRVEIEAWISKN